MSTSEILREDPPRNINEANRNIGSINTEDGSPDWLFALIDVGNTKEQNSEGLESIGDAVTSTDKSKSPMDNPKGDGKDDKSAETASDLNVEDDGSGDDNGTNDTTDENTNTDDSSDDNNLDNDPNSMSDDSTSSGGYNDNSGGMGSEVIPQDATAEKSGDPHLSLNRRILISTKLLELNDSIKNSMDILANGSSFENKPTILEQLHQLSKDVIAINSTVSKVEDYQTLLVKYSVCVRTYNKIIGK